MLTCHMRRRRIPGTIGRPCSLSSLSPALQAVKHRRRTSLRPSWHIFICVCVCITHTHIHTHTHTQTHTHTYIYSYIHIYTMQLTFHIFFCCLVFPASISAVVRASHFLWHGTRTIASPVCATRPWPRKYAISTL
jgi:hypothetical protein